MSERDGNDGNSRKNRNRNACRDTAALLRIDLPQPHPLRGGRTAAVRVSISRSHRLNFTYASASVHVCPRDSPHTIPVAIRCEARFGCAHGCPGRGADTLIFSAGFRD